MKKIIVILISVLLLTIMVTSIASADEGDGQGAFVRDDGAIGLGGGFGFYLGLPSEWFVPGWWSSEVKFVQSPSGNAQITIRWIMPYSAGTQEKLEDIGVCSLVSYILGREIPEMHGYFHVSPDDQELVLKCTN